VITCSQVQLSELELGRTDAEYYRPNLLSLSRCISATPNVSIKSAGAVIDCSAFYPSIVPHYNFHGEGIPFLRVNEIQNGLLSINERTAFLPKDILDLNRSTIALCDPGDLIVAKGGNSLGKVALLTNLFPKYSVCRDVLVVRTQGLSRINKFTLWMYLHSRPGQLLLLRTASQTGQPHLTIESIARLRIPLLPNVEQGEIEASYLASEHAMATSRSAYAKAQQLLQVELGLDKLTLQKNNGYAARFSTVGLSDTFLAGRVDAQCFAPAALFYDKWLQAHARCDRLSSLLQDMVKGRQQAESPNGSTDYCSIKHISGRELVAPSKCFAHPDTPLAVQEDLLLAITGATIGKTGIVKRYTDLAFSGDVLRLRTNSEIDPNYLLLTLDHQLGQVQLIRWISGSTYGHLAPRDVARVLVPRLGKAEDQIAGLVKA